MQLKAEDQVSGAWQAFFKQQFELPYMQQLRQFLQAEKLAEKVIYPHSDAIFNAFVLTPLEQVKVVIVGQDPYHGAGQAHGLSFSVPEGVALPPSLKNIYKELHRDLGLAVPGHGCLTHWAKQGVMLLNSVLTVEQGNAGSHQKKGWEQFTNAAVELINQQDNPVVFLAWGKFAHGVCSGVDQSKHQVIQTSHPSPLGATKSGRDFDAFLGSHCFSRANRWLLEQGRAPIDWSVPTAQ